LAANLRLDRITRATIGGSIQVLDRITNLEDKEIL